MSFKLLSYIFFIVLVSTSTAFSQQYQSYKQLDDSWYSFDDHQRHQSYTPSRRLQEIYLTLDRSLPDSSILQMFIEANTSIFINKKIVDFTTSDKAVSYSIDSLFLASTPSEEQLTVMLYNEDNVVVRNAEILIPIILSNQPRAALAERVDTSYENMLLIFLLLTLLVFVYIKIAHADIWRAYMMWSRIGSLKDQGDAIYKLRVFERGTLMIVLAYAALGATVILGLLYLLGFPTVSTQYLYSSHLFGGLIKWLGLVLLFFVLAFGKYFQIKMFTRLFDFKGASRIHFYNHIRIYIVILVILATIEITSIFGFHIVTYFNWLGSLIIILLILKSLLVSLKLIKISTYRIFHLFSYLCATEIIPAIIFVKITFLT